MGEIPKEGDGLRAHLQYAVRDGMIGVSSPWVEMTPEELEAHADRMDELERRLAEAEPFVNYASRVLSIERHRRSSEEAHDG